MSFELTLNKNLIFINQGISTYNANFKRFIERSSCNYNTLQLHNYNSNEVWKSFRVARRAKVFDLKLINKKNIFQIQAKHDGYRKYGLTHQRSISLKKKELIIKDNIYGKSKLPSFIRFHLNHNIKVKTLTKNKYNLYLENKKIAVISSNNEISIIHKYQNLDFNKSKKNILLLIKIQNNTENIFNAKFH